LDRRGAAAHGQTEGRAFESGIAPDSLEPIAARDGRLFHLEAELLRVGREIFPRREGRPRLVGLGLSRSLAPLGPELLLDLGRDFTKGLHPRVLNVQNLDGVVPEWRPHGLGRDLSLLEGEDPFLELRHHLTLADESQLAPCPAVAVSSEISLASLPKSSPAFTRRMASAILALDLFSASLPPVGGTRTRMCAVLSRFGRSNSAPCSL